MPKFLIIGDLHGRKPKIHFKDFDYIIAPGDFCSDKGIRPLYNKWFKALNKNKNLNWDKFLRATIGKRNEKKFERENLKVGRKILEYLNSFNKPVFVVPGNWDQSTNESKVLKLKRGSYARRKASLRAYSAKRTNHFLTRGLKNTYDCQYRLYKFPDFNIVGYGLSSYPEKPTRKGMSPSEYKRVMKEYNKLLEKLDKQYKKRNKKNPTIFLTHNVPYNTPLDKVIAPGSYAHNKHYGSNVARDFIKKRQPLVCIGGHIHEHFGKCKIGRTIAINAGFGSYVNVWMELDGYRIKKLKFYRGK